MYQQLKLILFFKDQSHTHTVIHNYKKLRKVIL